MSLPSGGVDSTRRSVAYLLAPCIAVLCAAGPIMGLRVGTVPLWISNLPFWIGMAGAPGYVYVWSERWRGRRLSRPFIYWVHVSMAAAFVASVWGALLLLLSVLFWVFPAISAWMTVQLWAEFRRRNALHNG
jgi:hypothetical protein